MEGRRVIMERVRHEGGMKGEERRKRMARGRKRVREWEKTGKWQEDWEDWVDRGR